MNYVFERDYALLVDAPRARQRGAGRNLPDRRPARLSGLHRSGLRARDGDRHRPSWRSATARDPSPLFPAYRQALPRPLGERGAVRDRRAGGSASPSRCPPRRGARALFLSATRDALRYRRAAAHLAQRRMVDRRDRGRRAAAKLQAIEGVLEIAPRHRPRADRAARRGAGGGDADPDRRAARGDGEGPGMLTALLLALLGGLVLNIMPCVFPILSLKALSLASAGGTEAGAQGGAGLCGGGDVGLPGARAGCCSPCAPAGRWSAGRSSCRTRA